MLKWFSGIILIISLALAATAALYFFYSKTDGVEQIQFLFKHPDEILSGQPTDISIAIANNSDKALSSAKLTLMFSPGVVLAGEEIDKNIIAKVIGDIGVNGFSAHDFKILVLEEADRLKQIEAVINYGLNGSNSQFETRQTFTLPVAKEAVGLNLEIPEKTTSNDQFEIKVSYKNLSGVDVKNLKFEIDYPAVFKFMKATLAPDQDNNVWNLGGLNRGSSNKFSIFGQLIAPINTNITFTGRLQLPFLDKNYDINIKSASTTIASAAFDLQLDLVSHPNNVVYPRENLIYSISFPDQLDNLKLQLVGEMFDLTNLAGDNVVYWTNPTSPVTFQIPVKSNYPIKRLGDKNFFLKALAEGRSRKDVSVAKLETKIGGQIKLLAKGYFRDALAGILNKGPLPPRVGEQTDFTVHWLLSNFATDIKNVQIKTKLAPGVKFSGKVKSNTPVVPNYNLETNEITWSLEKVLATQGVISDPLEAVFQVTAMPTENLVGQYLPLIGETTLFGVDDFTGVQINAIAPAVTTVLPDDLTVGTNGIVSQ